MNYKKYRNLTIWLKEAVTGDVVVYHEGLLMLDRQMSPGAHKIADKVMSLYAAGVVELIQNKNSDGDYTYMAVMK